MKVKGFKPAKEMAGKDSRGQVTLIRHSATKTAGKKTADKNQISNSNKALKEDVFGLGKIQSRQILSIL